MDNVSNVFKAISQCQGCSKSKIFQRKRSCFSCKKKFCDVCIIQQPDQQRYCRKCQILTATPLDKNELLKLRSRDLVNFLASKHISTSGCVEKEDLVNVLIRAVNNSGGNSNSNSPLKASRNDGTPRTEESYNDDGIRITGTSVPENEGSTSSSNHNTNEEDLNESDWIFVSGVSTDRGSGDRGSNGANNSAEEKHKSEANDTGEATGETARAERTAKRLKLSDISCSADLDNLSVKELKILLMTNRTDFKGCVERTELIEKASRLWSDYTLSRRDLEKLSLEELCKICMDAPIECVLLECGHMATCMCCGKQLSECPVCRRYVVRCVRTFKV